MPTGTILDSRDPNSPQWGYLEVSDTSDLEYDAKDINWNDIVLFVHDQKKNPIEKTKFAKVSNSNSNRFNHFGLSQIPGKPNLNL